MDLLDQWTNRCNVDDPVPVRVVEHDYLPNLERRSWKELSHLGSILLIATAVLVVFNFQGIPGSNPDDVVFSFFFVPFFLSLLSLFSTACSILFICSKDGGVCRHLQGCFLCQAFFVY
ncbi:hypothetical protein F5Y18DRAFT_25647 [Xylariaceae sp. FL1019]|nr:hypothetical protein F5Y18DRAFT_25647 [Xylariaceae sp. FL1019]